ncbi:MAG: helix-turn-helix transcriptional regulator [Ilumatobacteraceae bacterium]
MHQLERVTNLLTLLLTTRRHLTFDEIRNELRGQYPENIVAARAAFERDKAVLRDEGIPIDSEILGGDRAGTTGYRILRSAYELGDLGLTSDESRALRMAVATLRMGRSWGEEALWKVETADIDSETVNPSIQVTWMADERVPIVHEAVSRRRCLVFTYHDRSRRVDPYGLLARTGWWYLVGFDHEAGALRTFRVDRIEGSVAAGPENSFAVPTDFDIRSAFPRDPKELPGSIDVGAELAVVRLDAAAVSLALVQLGDEAVVQRLDDGRVDVEVPCSNVVAFTHWVLGYMDRAEVLSPPALRRHIVEWLEDLVSGGVHG